MFLLHIEGTNEGYSGWEEYSQYTEKVMGKWFSQLSKPVMYYLILNSSR